MTLHFYAPIYMLLTICDRDPDREAEALKTLEAHIRQFNRLYARNEEIIQNNKKKSRRKIKGKAVMALTLTAGIFTGCS